MPKFSANLSLLFTEHAFLDRFAAAARAGFTAVECQFPYAFDKHEIAARLRKHQLRMVLHNLPAGDWAAGDRGIACDAGRIDEFRHGVEQAITYATTLDCPQLNCLAGIPPSGQAGAVSRETFVANLRYAADALKAAGLRLLIEPINTRDIPGFYLHTSAQALALIDAVGSDALFLQYDIYHAQRMEGELAATIAATLPHIGHMQLADNPGRHEPGSGEINFAWLLPHIDALGYTGWVGCEYHPAAGTEAGLRWLEAFRR
ncbi:hydroxypyruvate isomerase [Parazoarcus communis]|uniref:Hydroxypyruvate isomerase n=1 Tax=Parazoarcus communis SWub3 = DSM 12120 TaxID=1121029 RepID=A0A323UZT6_9RHOO|nr:hydroxypyruvate isomerase [Parazoarcus communis]NMG70351.1 hydroxypyruvate isomerase [Parazoarcus communis SWub3 = DSM 12120]PZA17220.1 hydroxypyruvate isomerase [Azoarcus communis] [Parazoarcus communis SWub3 = DSM 12120]